MSVNPRSIAASRLGLALSLALALALASWPRTARAEPFELELRFAPEVAPCFTREQLLAATKQRIARRAGKLPTDNATDTDAPASVVIALEIGAAPGGWRAAITSVRLDGGELGVRELAAAGCADLHDALSLVLALIVEEAAGERPRAPSAPQDVETAPSFTLPRHVPPLAREHESLPIRIAAASGFGFGVAPVPLPLIAASLEIPLTTRRIDVLPLFAEIGADVFLPREIARDGWRVSIAGAGVQTQLCARFESGPLAVAPCAGQWLRVLHAGGEGKLSSAIETEAFMLNGWDLRLHVGLRVSAVWTLYWSGELLAPFAGQTMRLRAKGYEWVEQSGTGPFSNESNAAPRQVLAAESDGAAEIGLYEVADIGAALRFGLALAL